MVFMSGGDVELGMRRVAEIGIAPFLRQLHRDGKPFFGASAGSIMLGRSWVRWDDPDDDATAKTFSCLGLADVICDTHAEDDEWVELKTALRLNGAGVGYGIPRGSALRVDGDGGLVAIGKPVVRFERRNGDVVPLAPIAPA